MALGEWYPLHVRVEEYELPYVPSETIPDSGAESLLQGVVDQVGVKRVPALGRVGHFDLSRQHSFVCVAPEQAKVVAFICTIDVLLHGCPSEGKMGVVVEVLGNPPSDFCSECKFVDWHLFSFTVVGEHWFQKGFLLHEYISPSQRAGCRWLT